MAYSIRYQPYVNRYGKGDYGIRLRIGLSLGLLILLIGLRMFWEDGVAVAERYLSSGPERKGERAVSALANALVAGQGLYRGMVAWCRVMMDV